LKFKTNSPAEPDINLIPFIDVLLVVLIFLMLTTTWSKFNEMNLSLPTANANTSVSSTPAWVVAVSAQGNYTVNGVRVEGRSAQDIGVALQKLAQADAALVIKADASASHQAVVNVLEAARSLGIAKIAFATQSNTTKAAYGNAKAAP
jgi:biopolymer transport protein ExbD